MGAPSFVEQRMRSNSITGGVAVLALLAGPALLTARTDVDASAAVRASSPASVQSSTSGDASARPHTFSQAYNYCYDDAEGRPMVVRKKPLVFFLPDAPPEVKDRTFIETNECQ
jgi:hypothetical protein